MKKIIKRKLYYQNGCSKNFFLWEVSNERGQMYEIIEEFKGHSIGRAMLRGIYNDRLKALAGFKQIVSSEESAQKVHTTTHRLVFN